MHWTLAILASATLLPAQEWPGFRGPDRSGIALDATPPIEWSDQTNIAWKTELPGPGFSSPVIAGDRLYLTSYSGYGLDADEPGNLDDLVFHLICIDHSQGEILWQQDVPSTATERDWSSMAKYHGYASPTPILEGDRIFTYFGRTGVVAFDTQGALLWHTGVGTGPSLPEKKEGEGPSQAGGPGSPGLGTERGWGSAASPLIEGDLLIVHAGDASSSLRALNKMTGDLVWQIDSPKLSTDASSPRIHVDAEGARQLLIAVLGELWSLDPATGKELWKAEIGGNSAPLSTPALDQDFAYVSGAGTNAVSLKANASDRVAWTSRDAAGIPSALLHEAVLYLVDRRGIPIAIDAANGAVLTKGDSKQRIKGGVYASPLLAGEHIYVLGREGQTRVFVANENLELIATNQLTDGSKFDASPVALGDTLFLRSNTYLYCIREDQ